jgi:hypothetical protein
MLKRTIVERIADIIATVEEPLILRLDEDECGVVDEVFETEFWPDCPGVVAG